LVTIRGGDDAALHQGLMLQCSIKAAEAER
jgi:hypothetical protein